MCDENISTHNRHTRTRMPLWMRAVTLGAYDTIQSDCKMGWIGLDWVQLDWIGMGLVGFS